MAHEVESLYLRKPAWHSLGTIVPEGQHSKEAMVTAGLDWEVTLEDIFIAPPASHPVTTDFVVVEGKKAVVRETDGAVMQIASDQYPPIQNWKAFEFFDNVLGNGDVKLDSAGSLKNGKIIFLTAKLDREILIGGVAPVDLYLLMANSHDGSMAFTSSITPVCTVCMNTLNLAIRNQQQSWRLKHIGDDLDGKVAQARDALNLTFAYAHQFEYDMNLLTQQEFTKHEFERMIRAVFPHKGNALFSPEQYAMLGVFESSPNINDELRYTKWGALQAPREWDDWGKEARVRKDGNPAETQMLNTVFGKNKKRSDLVLSYLQD